MADYTPDPADVELLCRTLADEDAHHWGYDHGFSANDDEETEAFARAVLSALAAAGRLRDTGGKAHKEYNLRFRNGHGRWIIDDFLTSNHPEDDWASTRRTFGPDAHEVHRTVTTWADGSTLVGPWLPAPTEDTPDD